jgi:hypothetical protein
MTNILRADIYNLNLLTFTQQLQILVCSSLQIAAITFCSFKLFARDMLKKQSLNADSHHPKTTFLTA